MAPRMMAAYMPSMRKGPAHVEIVIDHEDKENIPPELIKAPVAGAATPRTELGPARHNNHNNKALSPVAGKLPGGTLSLKQQQQQQQQQQSSTPIRGGEAAAGSTTPADAAALSSGPVPFRLNLGSVVADRDNSLSFSPAPAPAKRKPLSTLYYNPQQDADGAVAPLACGLPQEEFECAPTPSAPSAAPSTLAEGAPTPAPPPVTPAPPRPAGEIAILSWLEDNALGDVEGLLAALLEVALDLTRLSELTDERLLHALKPLKLRSLKIRKIHAAIIALRAERDAFNRTTFADASPGGTPDTTLLRAPRDLDLPHNGEDDDEEADKGPSPTAAAAHDFIEPPHPRLGERNRAGFGRFLPRTVGGRAELVPPSPESAAAHLGLTGPSEARELGELATLLGGGRPSARASKWEANIHAGVLASAAAREAAVAREMADASRKEEALKVDHSEARAAFGVLPCAPNLVTPRTQKQIDALRLVDLQTRLDQVASAMGDLSPERMQMMSANAPRDPEQRAENVKVAQRKKVPRKKQPPLAPVSTRVTRSMSAAAAALAPAPADGASDVNDENAPPPELS